MTPKAVHIVFTTIFVPEVLRALADNLERHGRLDEVKVWVVGDRKTPEQARVVAREACGRGLETEYLDVADQDAWGRRIGPFYSRLPYNNETRRNIGYLRALEAGCRILISIDDDNFPGDEDFVGGHLATGSPLQGPLLHEESGFHNICEYLDLAPARPVFPRGYPFKLRSGRNDPRLRLAGAGARVGVTAGLWLNEPDVDATTWLNGPVKAVGYRGPDRLVLSQDTWTPINTQNTSVVRELIPAYLCVPMGYEVPGGKIQRYGDIWGGYFLQALMQGTCHHVCFGRPLAEHRRNPHDYVDDLRQEYWGMILTDWLVGLLRADFRPRAASIVGRTAELSEFLLSTALPKLPAWAPEEMKRFLAWTAGNVETWGQAARTCMGGDEAGLDPSHALAARRVA